MNAHLIAGCVYLVLNTLLPWALALLLWRRIGRRAGATYFVAGLMLAVSFTLGGVWYTVIDRLLFPTPQLAEPSPYGYNPVAVFVLCGGFSVGFFMAGSFVVLGIAVVWERIAPASLERLTRCKTEMPRESR
jgi:hypothetical protein